MENPTHSETSKTLDDYETYQVDKQQQLVRINDENRLHFSCFFEVKSDNDKPFQLAVVEQSDIKPKKFETVQSGYINGNLVSDEQGGMYFLVLKAQQPCECKVKFTFKERPPQSSKRSSQQSPRQQSSNSQDRSSFRQSSIQPSSTTVGSGTTYIKYVAGAVLLLVVVYLILKYGSKILKDSDGPRSRRISSVSATSY
jgi:hypothetical protein